MLLGVATWKCLGKVVFAMRLEAHALRDPTQMHTHSQQSAVNSENRV